MILNYYAIVNNRPPAPRSEDGSTGGGWGEEGRSVRAWKPRRTAQKLLGRNRAEISLSFFEFFFRGRAQKKNCKGKFLRGCRRSVSGGGRRGGSSSLEKGSRKGYNFTASWENANLKRSARGVYPAPNLFWCGTRRLICIGFSGQKEIPDSVRSRKEKFSNTPNRRHLPPVNFYGLIC